MLHLNLPCVYRVVAAVGDHVLVALPDNAITPHASYVMASDQGGACFHGHYYYPDEDHWAAWRVRAGLQAH